MPPYYAEVLAGRLHPNGTDNTGMTEAMWREMIAMTYGMITHVDAEIGRVLAALEATCSASGQSLRENTVIVFLGDHGDMLGDHGLLWKGPYTFQPCTRIPTLVTAPGAVKGQVSDALIAQVDLLPSILEACGTPLPGAAWQEQPTPFERGSVTPLSLYPGRSWLPVVRGESTSVRDSVVIENDDPTTGYRVRCLVTAVPAGGLPGYAARGAF